MNYCLISICSNSGHNTIHNGIICDIITTLDKFRDSLKKYWFIDPMPEDEWNIIKPNDVSENRDRYIEYVIDTIININNHDKVLDFSRLMYNHLCCELYMYCTNNNDKIVKDINGYTNIILRDEEIKILFGK